MLPALVVCLTTASAWVVAPPTHSLARTRGAELTRVAAKKAAAEKDSRLWEGDVRRARTRPHVAIWVVYLCAGFSCVRARVPEAQARKH